MFASVSEKLMYTSKNRGYAKMGPKEAKDDLRAFDREHKLYSDLQNIANSNDFTFKAYSPIDDVEAYKSLLKGYADKGCVLIGQQTLR
jgi:hypothetical protein